MRKNKRAFTLIELLVAMGIIAVLVTLSIVAIGIVQRSLRNTQRRDVANTVNIWIASYFEREREYPPNCSQGGRQVEAGCLGVNSSAFIFDQTETIVELSGATSYQNFNTGSSGHADSDGTEYCYSSNGSAFMLRTALEPSGEFLIEDDASDSLTGCTF